MVYKKIKESKKEEPSEKYFLTDLVTDLVFDPFSNRAIRQNPSKVIEDFGGRSAT